MCTNESSDEEDEAAELMRELDKIKKERQAQKEKEVCGPSTNKTCADNFRNVNVPPTKRKSERSILLEATRYSTRRTLT